MKDVTTNPNTELWNRVCVTDPAAVKPITGKQYSGNSPKPYWIVQRLTEEFGPCGLGWGYIVLNERMERMTETDILHIAVVRFWYVLDGKRGEVEQIGQTKAAYKTSKGSILVDEDAPKKSVTDALVKCASYIGFAGDIFSGRWDDSKYVAWAREQYSQVPGTEGDKPANDKPDMSPKARAARIVAGVKDGDAEGAANALAGWDQEEIDAVWKLLPADVQDKLSVAWPA